MYSLAHARVNPQAKAFMSAWTAVIPNSCGMFLIVIAVDKPLRPMANRFGGCFCLGSGPVLWVLFCFCCLLRCFRWRNASLAGGFAGRRFWFGRGFCFCCFNRFADSKDPLSLNFVFPAYSHVRTEPLARHRPHSRKKTIVEVPARLNLK